MRQGCPPDSTRRQGQQWEAIAEAYLSQAGLRLLERNAHFRQGEIDRIFVEGDTLVFVEVRYRSPRGFGGGLESITPSKQRKLLAAAQLWLAKHPQWTNQPCRFDVIAISGERASAQIEWIKNAIYLNG